jgi:hypothetical protein
MLFLSKRSSAEQKAVEGIPKNSRLEWEWKKVTLSKKASKKHQRKTESLCVQINELIVMTEWLEQ